MTAHSNIYPTKALQEMVDEEKIVAVLDLGGGTFDVSIVDFFDGVVEE